MTSESILEEAQRLTHGDRNKDYGHPLDDYTRTAALATALLAHKLTEAIAPHEMAMVMMAVKMSRQINRPKRDNMVDAAGYAWVSQECLDEAARRSQAELFPDAYQLTPDPLQPEERIVGMVPELSAPFGEVTQYDEEPVSIADVVKVTVGPFTPGRLELACGCKGYCKGHVDVSTGPDVAAIVPTGTRQHVDMPYSSSFGPRDPAGIPYRLDVPGLGPVEITPLTD